MKKKLWTINAQYIYIKNSYINIKLNIAKFCKLRQKISKFILKFRPSSRVDIINFLVLSL